MPFKFWRKGEKKPVEKAEEPAAEAPPSEAARDTDQIVLSVHRRLVEAGLTIEGTREVFKKRVLEKFGSSEAFAQHVRKDGPRSVTRFLASWIGFEIDPEFTLEDLLYGANQRLSSLRLKVDATEEVHVNDAEGLREATLTMGDRAVTIQYRTPRDVFNEINDMLADYGVLFLELETWSDASSFILARTPQWDKLAAGDFVVVKAAETAEAGECPECGSPIGVNWARCVACDTRL